MKLIEVVGRGASGVVYRGHDRVLGRAVAVKFLHRLGGTGSTSQQQRFLDEARAGAAVRHPNLVEIHQAGMDGQTPYLILQFVEGETLAQVLRRQGPLSIGMVAAILEETAAAVDELHRHGIIHRDIKPSNILLDSDGHVHVSDLGICLRRLEVGGISEAGVAGTPAYMAPELFDGRVSARGDIYALGITLFELLMGKPPFEGNMEQLAQQHARDALPAALLVAHGIRGGLIDVVERATHKQPLFRYKSAGDLARAFTEAAGTATDRDRSRRELAALLARQPTTPVEEPIIERTPVGTVSSTVARMAELKRRRRIADDTSRALPLPELPPAMPALISGCVDSATSPGETIPPPARLGAPVRAPRDAEVPCIRCGYDLRGGCAPDARCPECGTHAAWSFDPNRVVFAEPRWLRTVAAGIALTTLTPVLIVVTIALNATLRPHEIQLDTHPILARAARALFNREYARGPFHAGLNDAAFGLESVMCLLPLATGTWLATRPREHDSLRTTAEVCRAAVLAPVGMSLLLAIASVLGLSMAGWIAVARYDLAPIIHRDVGFGEMLASIDLLAPIPLLWYVGRLARSLPEPLPVRRVRRVAILLLAAASIFVVLVNLGSVHWSQHPMGYTLLGFVAAFAVLGAMIFFLLAVFVSQRLFMQLAARRDASRV